MRIVTRSLMVVAVGAAFTFAGTSPLWAAGCSASCGGHGAETKADPHAGHGGVAVASEAAQAGKPAPAVVSGVLEQYAKIQTALAGDSTDGVREAAQAIAKQAKDDSNKTLPADVAAHAEILAKANDLAAARTAFKALSASLSRYLSTANIQTGHYFQMHCGMAKADWLQTDKDVKNPYYGGSMLRCGQLVAAF
ncbi:MAG: hypothetical protein PCFJNLEI_01185 [Verrucomicrobiae bacterium]|nr:hypothetical protein [Verrucomicrobiae bacterium]